MRHINNKEPYQFITVDELEKFYKAHSKVTKPKFPKEGWLLILILVIGLIWEYLSHA
jgi:hypothetical protein